MNRTDHSTTIIPAALVDARARTLGMGLHNATRSQGMLAAQVLELAPRFYPDANFTRRNRDLARGGWGTDPMLLPLLAQRGAQVRDAR